MKRPPRSLKRPPVLFWAGEVGGRGERDEVLWINVSSRSSTSVLGMWNGVVRGAPPCRDEEPPSCIERAADAAARWSGENRRLGFFEGKRYELPKRLGRSWADEGKETRGEGSIQFNALSSDSCKSGGGEMEVTDGGVTMVVGKG
jgi:hypothetical protein